MLRALIAVLIAGGALALATQPVGAAPKTKTLGPWGVPDSPLHLYGDVGAAGHTPGEIFAQGFAAPGKINVLSVSIRGCLSGVPQDPYFVTITSSLDGTPLGTSQQVDVSGVVDIFEDWQGEWIEFPFAAPVSLSKGDYFVQMHRSGTRNTTNYLNVLLDSANPIEGQEAWLRSNGEWALSWEGFDDFLLSIDYRRGK